MITSITLENFKCFRKVEVNPKLVTLFIGPNGTGKSGVLQALLLLKQSKDAGQRLELRGKLVTLSPDEFMLHGVYRESNSNHIRLTCSGISSNGAIGLRDFHDELEYSHDGILRQTLGPEITVSKQLSPGLKKSLQCLLVVPATRGLTRQTYTLGPSSHDLITLTAGPSQQEDELASTLAYSRAIAEKISAWVKLVTDVGFKTNLVPSQSIKPVSITATGEVSLTAEGFGTNALVQLLLELARAEKGATILMEEPEIHLHPRAQAELASVIVEEAKASNKQVIMTTHSEHIANRLLTLVAEKQLTPDDVAVYAFEKDAETGVCSASEIEVTERGQVKGGLKSFFEAHMEEMRRYGDALRSQI